MLILRPKGSSSARSNAIVRGDKERLRWYLSSVLKVSVQGLCTVFALLNVAGWFRRRRALRFRAWEHSFLYFTEPNGFGYSRARKFYRVERPPTKPAKHSHKHAKRAANRSESI